MDTNQHTEEKQHKQAIRAWTMYDWANSAFATTVMGVVLPTYFASYIAQGASVPIWGNAVAIGSLLAALLSPILGAIADFKASKKTFMAFFAALGIISTALRWCFMIAFCPTLPMRTKSTKFLQRATRWATSAAVCCSLSTRS